MPFSRNNMPNISKSTTTKSFLQHQGQQEHRSFRENAFARLDEDEETKPLHAQERDGGDGDDYAAMKQEMDYLRADSASAVSGFSHGIASASLTTVEEVSEEPEVYGKDWAMVERKERPNGRNQILGRVWRPRTNTLLPSNWRTGKTVNASGYTAPKTGDAHNYARQGKTNYGGAAIGFSIHIADLRVGIIVHHKDLRECFDESMAANEKEELFKSPEGQLILRKGRYFIITKVCEFHMNEAPLYTYRKAGIAKKSERVKKQHVGVRPLHMSPQEYKRQNEYQPLVVEQMADPKEKLHETTVLHFTEQRSTPFDTPIRIIGHLTPDSIERLRKLRADAAC